MGTQENPIDVQGLTGREDQDSGVGGVSVKNQTMVDLFGDQKEVNEAVETEGLKENEVNGAAGIDIEAGLNEEGDSGKKIEALGSGGSGVVEARGDARNDGGVEVDKGTVGEGEGKELVDEENCVVGTEEVEISGVQVEELQESMEVGGACEEVEKVSGSEEGRSTGDRKFSVGELVWAKTLNRPWWPGQIYDPSDASKDIAMYHRKDRLLVAFFGDEMAAWCYPSLVKSFHENFVEMSMQWNSTSFNNAVEEALRTVGMCVELQMTCVCSPLEVKTNLLRPLASSSGIRQGVVVPECRIDGLSVTEFEPAKFVSRFKCISEIVSEISLLERTVFQSQLLAYNRANGWRQTDVYLSLMGDSDGEGVEDDPTSKPLSSPHEVVRPSTPRSNGTAKKRRRKNDKFTSDSRKTRKGKDSDVGINGDSAFSGSSDLSLQNDDAEAKEGNKTGFLSRERRKSKYLSPPYTNLSPGFKSLIALKDSVPKSPKTPRLSLGDDSMGRAARLKKCSGGTGRKKQSSGEKINANVDASEVLSELYFTALDSMYLEESEKYDHIKGFFVSLRRHRYLPDHQIDTELGSLRKALRKTEHPKNEEGTEAGGAKEGPLSPNPQKQYAEVVFSFPDEDMDQTHHSTALGGTDMNAKQMKKERRKRKKGAMSGSSQKEYVDIVVSLSQSPLRKDARRLTNEQGVDKGEGKEGTMSSGLQGNYVDIPINLSGTVMPGVNLPTALVDTEMNAKHTNENLVGLPGENFQNRNARDWKEDARSQNRQGNSMDSPVVSPGEGVHDSSSCPTSEDGTEKNKQDRTEDSGFQISQGELIDVAIGSVEKFLPGIDCLTPESGPSKRIRKKKNAMSEGIQIRTEKAASLTKKKIHPSKTETSAALLLSFGPEVPLPTKEDLVTLFGRFGALNEVETQVMKDTKSAQVVFLNRSNAEEAFTNSQKVSPFGSAEVNYRLEGYTTYSQAPKPMVNSIPCIPNPAAANALGPSSALPPNGEAPSLSFMQEKLQIMKAVLEKQGDNVAPEMKSYLESEIEKLMKKLETVA